MKNFDAIFFDVDGTLTTDCEIMRAGFRKAFAKHGYTISTDPWRGSGCTDYQIFLIYLSDYDLSPEETTRIADEIAEDQISIILETLKNEPMECCPGIPELLAALKAAGIPFGLLTGNHKELAGPKLAKAGLDPNDFSYGGFGNKSPKRIVTAQRALQSASEYFGFPIAPERSLVIGDTPNDIRCAHELGAKALAVATGKYSMDQLREFAPDYLMQDLTDIPAFMALL